jgi:hypothetical protein
MMFDWKNGGMDIYLETDLSGTMEFRIHKRTLNGGVSKRIFDEQIIIKDDPQNYK